MAAREPLGFASWTADVYGTAVEAAAASGAAAAATPGEGYAPVLDDDQDTYGDLVDSVAQRQASVRSSTHSLASVASASSAGGGVTSSGPNSRTPSQRSAVALTSAVGSAAGSFRSTYSGSDSGTPTQTPNTSMRRDGDAQARKGRRRSVSSTSTGSGSKRLSLHRDAALDLWDEIPTNAELHSASARAEENSLDEAFWYKGFWTRDQATEYLDPAEEGSFLVRKAAANTKQPDFVLCVRSNTTVRHVLLKCLVQDGKEWYNVAPTLHYFNMIYDVIWYCQVTNIVFDDGYTCRLNLTGTEELKERWEKKERLDAIKAGMKKQQRQIHKQSKGAKKADLFWFIGAGPKQKEESQAILEEAAPGAFVVRGNQQDKMFIDIKMSENHTETAVVSRLSARQVGVENAKEKGAPFMHVDPSPHIFEHIHDLVMHAEKEAIVAETDLSRLDLKATKKAFEAHKARLSAEAEMAQAAGKDEFVPESKKAKKTDLLHEPWFRPPGSHDQCKEILSEAKVKAGAFAVRPCDASEKGKYVIYVKTLQGIKQERVLEKEHVSGIFVENSNQRFENLVDLLHAAEKNMLPLSDGSARPAPINIKRAIKACEAYDKRMAKLKKEKEEWKREALAAFKDGCSYHFTTADAERFPMDTAVWMRPWADKEEVASFLGTGPERAFCLRSASARPGHFILSVSNHKGGISNLEIQSETKADSIWFYETSSKDRFEHLFDLVNHAQKWPIGGDEERLLLSFDATDKAYERYKAQLGSDAEAIESRRLRDRLAYLEKMTQRGLEAFTREEERKEKERRKEKAEQERKRKAEEKERLAKEAAEKAEAEAKRKAEEEAKRAKEEALRNSEEFKRAEEERKAAEERRKAEEEARKREAEEKRLELEAKARLLAEREEQARAEAEARHQEEAKRLAELEAEQQRAEEARRRLEAEQERAKHDVEEAARQRQQAEARAQSVAQELDEREAQLKAREERLRADEAAFEERQKQATAALDAREQQLDVREEELDAREQRLEKWEAELNDREQRLAEDAADLQAATEAKALEDDEQVKKFKERANHYRDEAAKTGNQLKAAEESAAEALALVETLKQQLAAANASLQALSAEKEHRQSLEKQLQDLNRSFQEQSEAQAKAAAEQAVVLSALQTAQTEVGVIKSVLNTEVQAASSVNSALQEAKGKIERRSKDENTALQRFADAKEREVLAIVRRTRKAVDDIATNFRDDHAATLKDLDRCDRDVSDLLEAMQTETDDVVQALQDKAASLGTVAEDINTTSFEAAARHKAWETALEAAAGSATEAGDDDTVTQRISNVAETLEDALAETSLPDDSPVLADARGFCLSAAEDVAELLHTRGQARDDANDASDALKDACGAADNQLEEAHTYIGTVMKRIRETVNSAIDELEALWEATLDECSSRFKHFNCTCEGDDGEPCEAFRCRRRARRRWLKVSHRIDAWSKWKPSVATVQIISERVDVSHVGSRISSYNKEFEMARRRRSSEGGRVKITSQPLDLSKIRSKTDSGSSPRRRSSTAATKPRRASSGTAGSRSPAKAENGSAKPKARRQSRTAR